MHQELKVTLMFLQLITLLVVLSVSRLDSKLLVMVQLQSLSPEVLSLPLSYASTHKMEVTSTEKSHSVHQLDSPGNNSKSKPSQVMIKHVEISVQVSQPKSLLTGSQLVLLKKVQKPTQISHMSQLWLLKTYHQFQLFQQLPVLKVDSVSLKLTQVP